MSVLTIILIVIAAIIVILLIAAAFTGNEYSIEREITINKPLHEVFDYIKYLKNQDHYNKWVMADPGMEKQYTGTDGTVGFVYAWNSNNNQVGKGELEIRKIVEEERVEHEIRFEKPFKATSRAYLTTVPASGGQTRVKWVFAGARNYTMKIFHLLFNLKKVLGKDMQASLMNLKTVLEKEQAVMI